MESRLDNRNKFFIALSFFAFIAYAFYFNAFGTNAPVMMDFYGITSVQQGFIITMQSVGSVGTAIFLALKGEKYNKIHVIALGILLMAVACVLIGIAPAYAWLIVFVTLAGVGFTLIDVMMNGAISEIYPKRKNTLLPVAHAFFGSGAMIAPVFVTWMVNPDVAQSFSRPFLIIGIGAVVVFVLYLISGQRIMVTTPYAHMDDMKKRATENPAEIFKTKTAWIFMLAGVLYFSFQMGFASWLPTYCIQEVHTDFSAAGMMLTAFFAGALVMRFSGALLLKKMTPKTLFIVFGVGSGILMALALMTPNVTLMTVLVVAGGFMQGSNVVTLVLMCCETFPKRTASASAIAVVSGSIAAMTAPLWIGGIAEEGGFRLPLFIACGCMFASVLIIFLLGKTHPELNER